MAVGSGVVRAGRAYVEISADNSQFARKLHETEATFRNFGSQMTQTSAQMLASMTAFAAPLAMSAKFYAEFDDVMRSVYSTAGRIAKVDMNKGFVTLIRERLTLEKESLKNLREAQAEYQSLTKTARELGATTSYTAKEAANSMLILARAGFKIAEIQESVRHILNLSRSTGTEVSEATQIMIGALRSFVIEASKAEQVVNLLVATANSSPQALSDIGSAMKYIGPVAKSLHLSLRDTLADLAALANFNIKGEQGGTALRNIYLRLASAKNQAKLKDLFGVDVVDANGEFRKIVPVLKEIHDQINKMGMSTADVANSFKDIFGMRSAPAALSLMNADLDRINEALADTSDLAEDQAKMMDEGLGGAIRMLISRLQELQIALSNAFSEPVKLGVKAITKALSFAARFVEHNKAFVKTIVYAAGTIGTLVASFGAMSLAIGIATRSTSSFMTQIRKLSSIKMTDFPLFKGLASAGMEKIGTPDIQTQNVDKAREATRYLNENLSSLSKTTVNIIKRFNRLAHSFDLISNKAEKFRKASRSFADNGRILNSVVKPLEKYIRNATSSFNGLSKSINAARSDTKQFSSSLTRCDNITRRFNSSFGSIGVTFNVVVTEITRSFRTFNDLSETTRRIASEVRAFNANTRDLTQGLRAIRSVAKNLNDAFAKTASKIESSTTALGNFNTKLLGIADAKNLGLWDTFITKINTLQRSFNGLKGAIQSFIEVFKTLGRISERTINRVVKVVSAINVMKHPKLFSSYADQLMEEERRRKEERQERKIFNKGTTTKPTKPVVVAKKAEEVKGPKFELKTAIQLEREADLINKTITKMASSSTVLANASSNVKNFYMTLSRGSNSAANSIGRLYANIIDLEKGMNSFVFNTSTMQTQFNTMTNSIRLSADETRKAVLSLRAYRDALKRLSIRKFINDTVELGRSMVNLSVSLDYIIQNHTAVENAILSIGVAFEKASVGAITMANAVKTLVQGLKQITPAMRSAEARIAKGNLTSVLTGKRKVNTDDPVLSMSNIRSLHHKVMTRAERKTREYQPVRLVLTGKGMKKRAEEVRKAEAVLAAEEKKLSVLQIKDRLYKREQDINKRAKADKIYEVLKKKEASEKADTALYSAKQTQAADESNLKNAEGQFGMLGRVRERSVAYINKVIEKRVLGLRKRIPNFIERVETRNARSRGELEFLERSLKDWESTVKRLSNPSYREIESDKVNPLRAAISRNDSQIAQLREKIDNETRLKSADEEALKTRQQRFKQLEDRFDQVLYGKKGYRLDVKLKSKQDRTVNKIWLDDLDRRAKAVVQADTQLPSTMVPVPHITKPKAFLAEYSTRLGGLEQEYSGQETQYKELLKTRDRLTTRIGELKSMTASHAPKGYDFSIVPHKTPALAKIDEEIAGYDEELKAKDTERLNAIKAINTLEGKLERLTAKGHNDSTIPGLKFLRGQVRTKMTNLTNKYGKKLPPEGTEDYAKYSRLLDDEDYYTREIAKKESLKARYISTIQKETAKKEAAERELAENGPNNNLYNRLYDKRLAAENRRKKSLATGTKPNEAPREIYDEYWQAQKDLETANAKIGQMEQTLPVLQKRVESLRTSLASFRELHEKIQEVRAQPKKAMPLIFRKMANWIYKERHEMPGVDTTKKQGVIKSEDSPGLGPAGTRVLRDTIKRREHHIAQARNLIDMLTEDQRVLQKELGKWEGRLKTTTRLIEQGLATKARMPYTQEEAERYVASFKRRIEEMRNLIAERENYIKTYQTKASSLALAYGSPSSPMDQLLKSAQTGLVGVNLSDPKQLMAMNQAELERTIRGYIDQYVQNILDGKPATAVVSTGLSSAESVVAALQKAADESRGVRKARESASKLSRSQYEDQVRTIIHDTVSGNGKKNEGLRSNAVRFALKQNYDTAYQAREQLAGKIDELKKAGKTSVADRYSKRLDTLTLLVQDLWKLRVEARKIGPDSRLNDNPFLMKLNTRLDKLRGIPQLGNLVNLPVGVKSATEAEKQGYLLPKVHDVYTDNGQTLIPGIRSNDVAKAMQQNDAGMQALIQNLIKSGYEKEAALLAKQWSKVQPMANNPMNYTSNGPYNQQPVVNKINDTMKSLHGVFSSPQEALNDVRIGNTGIVTNGTRAGNIRLVLRENMKLAESFQAVSDLRNIQKEIAAGNFSQQFSKIRNAESVALNLRKEAMYWKPESMMTVGGKRSRTDNAVVLTKTLDTLQSYVNRLSKSGVRSSYYSPISNLLNQFKKLSSTPAKDLGKEPFVKSANSLLMSVSSVLDRTLKNVFKNLERERIGKIGNLRSLKESESIAQERAKGATPALREYNKLLAQRDQIISSHNAYAKEVNARINTLSTFRSSLSLGRLSMNPKTDDNAGRTQLAADNKAQLQRNIGVVQNYLDMMQRLGRKNESLSNFARALKRLEGRLAQSPSTMIDRNFARTVNNEILAIERGIATKIIEDIKGLQGAARSQYGKAVQALEKNQNARKRFALNFKSIPDVLKTLYEQASFIDKDSKYNNRGWLRMANSVLTSLGLKPLPGLSDKGYLRAGIHDTVDTSGKLVKGSRSEALRQAYYGNVGKTEKYISALEKAGYHKEASQFKGYLSEMTKHESMFKTISGTSALNTNPVVTSVNRFFNQVESHIARNAGLASDRVKSLTKAREDEYMKHKGYRYTRQKLERLTEEYRQERPRYKELHDNRPRSKEFGESFERMQSLVRSIRATRARLGELANLHNQFGEARRLTDEINRLKPLSQSTRFSRLLPSNMTPKDYVLRRFVSGYKSSGSSSYSPTSFGTIPPAVNTIEEALAYGHNRTNVAGAWTEEEYKGKRGKILKAQRERVANAKTDVLNAKWNTAATENVLPMFANGGIVQQTNQAASNVAAIKNRMGQIEKVAGQRQLTGHEQFTYYRLGSRLNKAQAELEQKQVLQDKEAAKAAKRFKAELMRTDEYKAMHKAQKEFKRAEKSGDQAAIATARQNLDTSERAFNKLKRQDTGYNDLINQRKQTRSDIEQYGNDIKNAQKLEREAKRAFRSNLERRDIKRAEVKSWRKERANITTGRTFESLSPAEQARVKQLNGMIESGEKQLGTLKAERKELTAKQQDAKNAQTKGRGNLRAANRNLESIESTLAAYGNIIPGNPVVRHRKNMKRQQALTELAAGRTNFGKAFNNAFGGMSKFFKGLKDIGRYAAEVGRGLTKTGDEAKKTTLKLKASAAGFNLMAWSMTQFNNLMKGVGTMLQMSVVMAVVGVILSLLGGIVKYGKWFLTTSKEEKEFERQEKAKEKYNETMEKSNSRIDEANEEHNKKQEKIDRLRELAKKDKLTQSEAIEAKSLSDSLSPTGTQIFEKKGRINENGEIEYEANINEEAIKEVVKNSNTVRQNYVRAKLQKLQENTPGAFKAGGFLKTRLKDHQDYLDNIEKDLPDTLKMLSETGEFTPETIKMLQGLRSKLSGGAFLTKNDENTANRYRALKSLVDSYMQDSGESSNVLNIAQMKESLEPYKKDIDEILSQNSVKPDEVEEAYKNYIEQLQNNLNLIRNNFETSGNKHEMRQEEKRLNQELMNTYKAYKGVSEKIREELRRNLPAFGGKAVVNELMGATVKDIDAIEKMKQHEIDSLDTAITYETEANIGQIREDYKAYETQEEIKADIAARKKELSPELEGYQEEINKLDQEEQSRLLASSGFSEEVIAEKKAERDQKIQEEKDSAKERKKEQKGEIESFYDAQKTNVFIATSHKLQQAIDNELQNVMSAVEQKVGQARSTHRKRIESLEKYTDLRAEQMYEGERERIMQEKDGDLRKQQLEEHDKKVADEVEAYKNSDEYKKRLEEINKEYEQEINPINYLSSLSSQTAAYANSQSQKTSRIHDVDAWQTGIAEQSVAKLQQELNALQNKPQEERTVQDLARIIALKQEIPKQRDQAYKDTEKVAEDRKQAIEEMAELEYHKELWSKPYSQQKFSVSYGAIADRQTESYSLDLAIQEQERLVAFTQAGSEEFFQALNRLAELNILKTLSDQYNMANEKLEELQAQYAREQYDYSLKHWGREDQTIKIEEETAAKMAEIEKDYAERESLAKTAEEKQRLKNSFNQMQEYLNKQRDFRIENVLATQNDFSRPIKKKIAEINVQWQNNILDALEANGIGADEISFDANGAVVGVSARAKKLVGMGNATRDVEIAAAQFAENKAQQDYEIEAMKYQGSQSALNNFDLAIAQLEAFSDSSNGQLNQALEYQMSLLKYNKARIEVQQFDAQLAGLQDQAQQAYKIWQVAVDNNATDEEKRGAFEQYKRLADEIQGVKMSMINAYKDVSTAQKDIANASNQAEKNGVGTFKAIEASRNSWDWQRENSVRQTVLLKQIADNTGYDGDII